ncbi:CGNR zinc finger domain-containing protein [Streptomyces fagopyri]|uniref:CGNR zinc finger domain-containing protein n=1 Tax=Streptomyces fagopyri TaxID=2662397 RepID=UPI0033F63659
MKESLEEPIGSGTDAAGLVLGFLNTRANAAGDPEVFATPDGFADWARGENLPDAGTVVTESDAVAARELRDALVTVLLAHAGDRTLGDEEVADAEARLVQASVRYPLISLIGTGGARLTGASTGTPGILGTVVAAVTQLALHDDWARLKACCNPPCHTAFVDRTRNRAARYCSPACNSQVSMRALRERRRNLPA